MKTAVTAVWLMLVLVAASTSSLRAQQNNDLDVIAYYAGRASAIDSFAVGQLNQIIFSFGRLSGNRLHIRSAADTLTIQKLVALKKQYPGLKVLVSLGGWGGCETCSDVFSSALGRKEFARSTKEIIRYFGADGIDLDWEYPAIAGYPGHKFKPEDKKNFTKLVKRLRKTLGPDRELSFAAGVSKRFFDNSVDWKKVMTKVNRVNLMTYDLAGGALTGVGHHTPLYSTPMQPPSAEYAIRYLDSLSIPRKKMVIGAGFYARIFEGVDSVNFGLYQKGVFRNAVSYREAEKLFTPANGFTYHWDSVARAPYYYNAAEKLFVTLDDPHSIQLKTQFAKEKGLGGIMFWQLTQDKTEEGLLQTIYRTKQSK